MILYIIWTWLGIELWIVNRIMMWTVLISSTHFNLLKSALYNHNAKKKRIKDGVQIAIIDRRKQWASDQPTNRPIKTNSVTIRFYHHFITAIVTVWLSIVQQEILFILRSNNLASHTHSAKCAVCNADGQFVICLGEICIVHCTHIE